MAATEPFARASELQDLGDPSGHKDSEYWNKWFQIVGQQTHNAPFEWYCSAEEVIRVLQYHLNAASLEETTVSQRIMIHPGSGTSMVPLHLLDAFPMHQQVIVDVSEVAIEEIKNIHARNGDKATRKHLMELIQYQTGNLLEQPPLPFADSSADAWVDKGFVDAIFSDKDPEQNCLQQSRRLFQEANRILTNKIGVALIVSLAEEHSLRLIIDRYLEGTKQPRADIGDGNSQKLGGWTATLHVWELEPSSGTMRPFGFVLQKEGPAVSYDADRTIVWHSCTDSDDRQLCQTTEHSAHADSLFALVHSLVMASQADFEARQRSSQKAQSASSSTGAQPRQVMLRLEIKPSDADVDLEQLGERIRSHRWTSTTTTTTTIKDGRSGRDLSPHWQPIGQNITLDKTVPIGFGISKLLLQCIIESDDVDELVDAITEWHDDDIQSVDVDWSNTVPVSDAADLLHKQ